jgi:hypothetical protein
VFLLFLWRDSGLLFDLDLAGRCDLRSGLLVRPSAWRGGCVGRRHLMLMRPSAGWAWDAVLARSGLVGSIVRQCGLGDGPTASSP